MYYIYLKKTYTLFRTVIMQARIYPQHRHRYSRTDFTINQSEDEVQEIFQRTMRSRLESFKSTKMGVTPGKKINKHPKIEPNQKVSYFF